jgi:pyruvate formate lyase activating enzyme
MSTPCTRRDFLRQTASVSALSLFGLPFFGTNGKNAEDLKEVMFYKKLEELKIECGICPQKCKVADRERGTCGNKENRGGKYYTLVYSKPCSLYPDPIEKKPLFHYLPGTRAFSIATAGCNFECRFCQNWRIAQFRPEDVDYVRMTPKDIVKTALVKDCPTIAYTYSEPTVFYGYMYDCAKLGRKNGVGSVMISNGFMSEEPLKELCKVLTGVKIDLKAFSEKFYKELCSGTLKPVLDTLVRLKKLGMWFELVVLIIPTKNDGASEINQMCDWIMENLGPDVPVHFTRFHPTYKLKNLPPTSVSTLERCYKIAQNKGINFPYIGNVPGHKGEHTYCPKCKKAILRRVGFTILKNNISHSGRCKLCNHPIPGVWANPAAV